MDRVALLVTPLVVGVAVGYGRGGRLKHMAAAMRLRELWWLWVAAGLQAVQFHVEPVRRLVQEAVGIPMRVLVYALPLVWFARNVGRIPRALRLTAGVALGGMVCNGLAILLNGRMPYVGEAARLAGVPPSMMTTSPPATADTVLVTLGDVIPVPGVHAVLSIGDLLLLAGVALSIVVLMAPGPATTTSVSGTTRTPIDERLAGKLAERSGHVGEVHARRGHTRS